MAALLCLQGFPLEAQEPISREYQIKALFLFNFTQFVKWPPKTFTSPKESFRIGILGEDPFGVFLDETVKGEKVAGHPLVIRRYTSAAEAKECQILFIARSEKDGLEGILSALKGRSILTVGDGEDFLKSGGVLRFVSVKNKIHLRISLGAARTARLDISSKMLRLADLADEKGEQHVLP